MNILLIQPQFKKSEKSYPLGLGYIGAALKQRGHKVLGIDLAFSSLSDVFSVIEREKIGLIGISLMSYNFKNALAVCRKIKKGTAIPLVAGGPHVTIFKEKLFIQHSDCFDYLVAGEGEETFSHLVECLQQKRSLGRLINNSYPGTENGLDSFPFPDRDLFPVSRYKGMLTRDPEYTQIITSRGCNHQCKYCPESTLWGNWRGRSIQNILSEITSIISGYGIREFHFEDANFFGAGSGRVRELCKQIVKNELKIKWQCPNGIPLTDFDDYSLLKLMARAGCYNISLGIESFDNQLLNPLGRSSNSERAEAIIRAAHRAGIEVIGYFIIGLPGQTMAGINNDIALSRKLNFDFIHYSIFHAIPGSGLYREDAQEANVKHLKRVRIFSSLGNCFKPRILLFILRSLKIIKDPFKFLRRIMVHLFAMDLEY